MWDTFLPEDLVSLSNDHSLWGRFSMNLTSCPSKTISVFGKTDNELANDMCFACWWWHAALKRLRIVFHNVFLCAWTWQIFGWKLVCTVQYTCKPLGQCQCQSLGKRMWKRRGRGEEACKLGSRQRMIPAQLGRKWKPQKAENEKELRYQSTLFRFPALPIEPWMRTSE